MAVLISVTEGDVTQVVLADVGVQGATGPSSPASGTPFTPYGNIAATNVQTAIQELDDEKFGKAGGTVTGNLEIGTGGTLSFEGATADGFETTLAVVDPTADRTLTLPNVTGTFITTGDTGTVTSTMLLDDTIVNGDISASAEIAVSKLADGTARQLLQTDAAGTGVEWTNNVDIPGTLDVTSTATFDTVVTIGGLNAVSTTKAQDEETQIKLNAAFSVGTAGAVPFGIGPVMPPGVAFAGIGADAYNPIHLNSGSFC